MDLWGRNRMDELARQAAFRRDVVPHLDAAYNLARWLLRNGSDAEDVTQEASMRAYKALHGFRGGSIRAWFLKIVRNACYDLMKKNRQYVASGIDDPIMHDMRVDVIFQVSDQLAANPEELLLAEAERRHLQDCLEALPVEYREAVILRELEGLSYREISEHAGIPIGTVMSRISRGRSLLQKELLARERKETQRG